ncbi:acylphosphatase [Sphingosinicella sp. LHD-64]|uniref:acylphosphatase n=1 Tax=Sphingosinicella sp. LHD-64 TaxID=3072139 RepID=UPI00280E0ACE|nr:acylphosphatase [Sphingosinicella sp. LHD-64]MDQ8758044.1 acylphosphatase [Sphingosinicella sp. LHD-64]
MIVRRLVIHGRVQGVFYRGWAVETARALGLRGWVRNRRDGTVEALIAGHEDALEQMIERCHEGPDAALVERVEVEDAADEPPAGFAQRPTV